MDINRRLEIKLDEIAISLLNHKCDNTEIGALTGISGNALFHFYYSRYRKDNLHAEKGAEIITETFNRIQKGYNYPTFCDGIAGACFVLELLKQEKFLDLEEDIITEEVDIYLLKEMNKFIFSDDFDFLHGAIGIGYYFLKRYENVKTNDLEKRYEHYLLTLIQAIKDQAIYKGDYILWESEIVVGELRFNGSNLGLAHGIPSIIVFLAKLSKFPIFSEKVIDLLLPACNYILSCKHSSSKLSSAFPNWITRDGSNDYNSRLAWCYGDLGTCISILQAAMLLKNEKLLDEVLQILKKTTNRLHIQEAGIIDAGMCHGAYGVMHIYDQVFKLTKDLHYKKSAEFWADIALNLAVHKDGHAGYKAHYDSGWKLENHVLQGISGIGLSIISYLNNHSYKWSELFLTI